MSAINCEMNAAQADAILCADALIYLGAYQWDFFRHKLKLNNWKAQVHSFMSKFHL